MFYYKIVSNASNQGPWSKGAGWPTAPPIICPECFIFFPFICKSISYLSCKGNLPITRFENFLLSHVFTVSRDLKSHPFLILIFILRVSIIQGYFFISVFLTALFLQLRLADHHRQISFLNDEDIVSQVKFVKEN